METFRFVVITDSESAIGFRLAGVETLEAGDVRTGEDHLRNLIGKGNVGIVAMNDAYIRNLDPVMLRKIEETSLPVLVGIPAGKLETVRGLQKARVAEFIQRVIGWRITLPSETAESTEQK